MINNTAGSVVGFKYYNFDRTAGKGKLSIKAHFKPEGIDGKVIVLVGGPCRKRGGTRIAEFKIGAGDPQQITEYTAAVSKLAGISGKQPMFFVFESETKAASICEFDDFQFIEY